MKKRLVYLLIVLLVAFLVIVLISHQIKPTSSSHLGFSPLLQPPINKSSEPSQPALSNPGCSYGSYKGKCLSPFGVFLDFTVDGTNVSLDYAKELGITRSRVILHWWQVEPKKGQLNFKIPDLIINKHYEAGIELVLTLMSSSSWGTRVSGSAQTFTQRSFASSPPTDDVAYENFVKSVVNRYKDKVAYWQIENEVFEPSAFWAGTKEEYAEHVKKTSQYIKEADPDAKVVLQGFATGVWLLAKNGGPQTKEFFDYVMGACVDYVDAIDFHHYEVDPTRVSDMLSAAAKQKEALSTEAGSIMIRSINDLPIRDELFAIPEVSSEYNSILSNPPVTEQACINFAVFLKTTPDARRIIEAYQAEDLVKRVSIVLADGAKEVLWDGMRDSMPNASADCFLAIMGLVDTDGRRKPHFYTYKMLIEKAGNVTGVEELEFGGTTKVIRYASKAGDLYVAWDDTNGTVDLSSYIKSGIARAAHIVTALDSNNEPVYRPDETIDPKNVSLTKEPIFIEAV